MSERMAEARANAIVRQRRRRLFQRVVGALACAVVFCTVYALVLPAVTQSAQAFCGLEEHRHTDACYERALVCGQEASGATAGHAHSDACYETERTVACGLAEGEATEAEPSGHVHTSACYIESKTLVCGQAEQAASPGHAHTDACYAERLACGKQEHAHSVECYSDPQADVETAEVWERTVPQDDGLTGEWRVDVIAVAESQLGYAESALNYRVADGGALKGYTRYGAWYGDAYGDWCAMFVSFCLHYAGVDEGLMPLGANCQRWIEALQKAEEEAEALEEQGGEGPKAEDLAHYRDAVDAEGNAYEPQPGDIVFFNMNAADDGASAVSDHVGIVEEYVPATEGEPARVRTIEGNSSDRVERNAYDADDPRIMGYASLPPQTFYCGHKGHIHTADCSDVEGQLSCGLEEHAHGEECLVEPQVEADDAVELTVEAEDAAAYVLERGLFTVSVSDPDHLVYGEGDADMPEPQAVASGGEASVTVRNADGVLWSCVGEGDDPLSVTAEQEGGFTTFTITGITQSVEVTATKANPEFTVQYYANIERFATSGSDPLKVIDTSGGVLPTNGGSMATKNLYLKATGQKTTQNAGEATELYKVATVVELTEMYGQESFHYQTSPGLAYFDKLRNNDSYTLKEIWVLKAGKDPSSTSRADWDIHPYVEGSTSFTNEASQAKGDVILITEGATIRLVSDSSTGDYQNDTAFYDYNISSGQNADGRWRTGITGINSEGNYGTSLNGQRTWRSGADIFAFGNRNCGTGMSGYLFDGGALNKANSLNANYGKATFGLVQGLNADGTLRYNDWIVAPNLFNDGDAAGKQTYAGSSLSFERVGDTYTLSSATLNNSNGQSSTIGQLQYFFHPSPAPGRIWDGVNSGLSWQSNIFTNNFWPMDRAAGRTDALWGAYGNPGGFQGFTETNDYNWKNLASDFPAGDDGNAHNWFFGMNFSLSFSLTEDYVGPLEYYFFGDDDLWVFLDGKLVCDIGGVHSSIGEYVNLRDYLPEGSSGQHTLSFFYTERGASGSTCYMSFTLPSVSAAATSQDTGGLQVSKDVQADSDAFDDEEYAFRVELSDGEGGPALGQTYSYAVTSRGSSAATRYGTVRSGGSISLKKGETATVSGIPAGTFYRVTETSTEGYDTTVNGSEGYIVSGTVETGDIKLASFVNIPRYELPETGGNAAALVAAGALLAAGGGALLARNYVRRKREGMTSRQRPRRT